MFERMTDHARRALVLAQAEARNLQHLEIGTEDLLIALMLIDADLPARTLATLGVPLETARKNVEKLKIPAAAHRPQGDVPFTERAKKSLEGALRDAIQLGDDYIGTEHLLFGIIRCDSDTVGTVYGVYPGTVRQAVVKLKGEELVASRIAAESAKESEGRSTADILFDIELQKTHLRELEDELAEAQKRECGIDPQYHH